MYNINMPVVDGTHYSYDKEGLKQAAQARAKGNSPAGGMKGKTMSEMAKNAMNQLKTKRGQKQFVMQMRATG